MHLHGPAIHAAENTLRLLRGWRYTTLTRLADTPSTPTELWDYFAENAGTAASTFGTHTINAQTAKRALHDLARTGLATRDTRRAYTPTPLAHGLLDALHALEDYAGDQAHYAQLVTLTRARMHVDPAAPMPPPDPRRGVLLIISVLFHPKWTFTVLALLTGPPLHFAEIQNASAALFAAHPDIATATRLSDSVLAARLDTLTAHGYTTRHPDGTYALTRSGRELLAALEPLAAYSIAHDAELTAAARTR